MANPNRKQNYRKLKQVGYTTLFAAKYRDFKQEEVDLLILEKTFQIGDKVITDVIPEPKLNHGIILEICPDYQSFIVEFTLMGIYLKLNLSQIKKSKL